MEYNGLGIESFVSNITEMKLLENRTLFISEGIDSRVAKKVVNNLLALDFESNKPITVYLNSPGGEVNSGFAIYDTMKAINSEVRICTAGLCASIATIINLGAPKKHRYGLPNSRFLIHQPLIGGHIQGQASDLEITAREIIKTRAKLNQLLAKECEQPFDRLEEDTSRDYWMNAEEAKDYGLIYKIIEKFSEMG